MSEPKSPESHDEFPIVQKLRELKQQCQQEAVGTIQIREQFDCSRYVLGESLHQGKRSAVFLAHDQVLDRSVVIKVYVLDDDSNRNQVTQEGQRLASIQSPFVCTCFDLGWSAGQPFLVLEAIAGRPMSDQKLAPPIGDWGSLTEVMIGVCRGVEDIHTAGLVHWDLKPSNILIGPNQQPKIVDLGLSLFRSDVDLKTKMLQGSPSYLAPEVARGESLGNGFLVDVFGIGAVLYEALTGQPPFKRATKIKTLEASFCAEIVTPREFNPRVPRRLESICLRCLADNPSDRFPSAQAVRKELEAFRTSLRHNRKRTISFAIGGLFIAVVFSLALSMLARPEKETADKVLLKQGIPSKYDATKISGDELSAALQSKTTSQLELRNDFDLHVTFRQQGKLADPLSLLPGIEFEIKLETERACFVAVQRMELDADGKFSLTDPEYPPPGSMCQAVKPDQPVSYISYRTAATRGPSCYYVIAAENEWRSPGDYPNARLMLELNHRGVTTKQPVSERIIPFAIVAKDP